MTIPDPKETERKMKKPVAETAMVCASVYHGRTVDPAYVLGDATGGRVFVEQSRAVLAHLVKLGFLNDSYFVAKKAEEAGDDVRKPQ